jgi:hypothetical protein
MTLHTPRIVDILAALTLLYLVNREAPRILPMVLGLLVLYALLTNVPRFVSLIDESTGSLGRTFGRRTATA